MSWKDIIKVDDLVTRAREVLRQLGVKEYETMGVELASDENLYDVLPTTTVFNHSEEELNRMITNKDLIELAQEKKNIYLRHTLDSKESSKQHNRDIWSEAEHEFHWGLTEALENNEKLPEWAVVEDGKINWSRTYKKYIDTATRENRYWEREF